MTTTREERPNQPNQPTDDEPGSEAATDDYGFAVGVIAAGVGVIAVAMPLLTGAVLSVWLGLLLVVLGVVRVEGLKRRETTPLGDVAAELLRAAGYVLVGILLVFFPLDASRLSVVLAVPLLLDGVGRLTGVLHREADRIASTVLGVALVAIAALLVVSWPSNASWALGTLFGLGLMVVGVAAMLGSRGVVGSGSTAR
ncbi:DUF308 domain-containing protein [Halobium salinum]|uniref:DUF308 domain-containing protein n=1 Tax=Halobium salinum TaxID=1364940 RepID=A0ABD5PHS4_9EURY|nr:DUF308 domain-containing protein [Halobium salinum]